MFPDALVPNHEVLSPIRTTCCCCLVAKSCPTLCDPTDCSPPGSSRQEYWSGLPFHSPGHLPNPGIKPASSTLTGKFFTTEPPGRLQFPTKLIFGRIW